jgi:hypothetical protein
MPDLRFLLLILAGVLASACTFDSGRAARRDSSVLAERAGRFDASARGGDSGTTTPLARWDLPKGLREISGLTMTADDRLFAHDDNVGVVYQIDFRRGVIVKQFYVGDPAVQGDFEAIAVAEDRFYLLTSDGMLYRFPEGADNARVAVSEVNTRLGQHCEFEGMTYEPGSRSLLLACKTVYQKTLEKAVLIYRWPLPDGEPLDRIVVPPGELGDKKLNPTDIAIHPETGNYMLITQEYRLVELRPDGTVVSVRDLSDRFHQPEGLAITRDGFVLISDEAGPRPASITTFRRLPGKPASDSGRP